MEKVGLSAGFIKKIPEILKNLGPLAIQSCECLLVICWIDIENKSLDTNYHSI